MNEAIILLGFLFLKHFIVDFPLQTRFQYSNKGIYGHPGGLLHAGLHGLGTYLCLVWISPMYAIYLALADFFLHYHIDWIKTNVNQRLGLGPTTHEKFWWLLGFDQLLHSFTYLGLVALIINEIRN